MREFLRDDEFFHGEACVKGQWNSADSVIYKVVTNGRELLQEVHHLHRPTGKSMCEAFMRLLERPAVDEEAFGLREEPLLDDSLTPEGRKRAERMLSFPLGLDIPRTRLWRRCYEAEGCTMKLFKWL